jgi:hypothetical protein
MRIQNAVIAWVIAAFFALPQSLQAQETIEHYSQRLTLDERACADFSKPINILSDQNGKYTLVFSDAAKGVVTKTIDIRENNPFSGLGKRIKGDYYDTYVTGNKKFKEVFPGFKPEPDTNMPVLADTTTISEVTVNCSFTESKNRQYAVVGYTMNCYGPCRTILIVYDSVARELNRITVDVLISDIAITNDGKFVGVSFSSMYVDPEGEPNHYEGIKIFRIIDGKLLVNRVIHRVQGISSFGSLFTTSTRSFRDESGHLSEEFIFVDLSSDKIYTKVLPVDILVKKISERGVLIHYYGGKDEMLLFDNDFIVEDIP